ncbi:MAG: hypothetical protein AB7E55_26395 [Pigmentiphaga sp.]
MRKADPSAHPHLRLVYSRPEPDQTAIQQVVMAMPDSAPSAPEDEWKSGTLDDFCNDLMRVAQALFDAEKD